MALRVARGLFRLWLVLSVLWIGSVPFMPWLYHTPGAIGENLILGMSITAFFPPLFVLALGSALVWAFRGFR